MHFIWKKIKYMRMLSEAEGILSGLPITRIEHDLSKCEEQMADVGVIQIEYVKMRNVKDFILTSLNLIRALVVKGCDFIVLPYGLHGFLFHDPKNLKDLERISEIFSEIFSKIAKGFGIWIYGGEFRFEFKDRTHRRFFLFSPSGKIEVRTLSGEMENPPIFETDRFSFSPMSSEELKLYEFVKMAVMKGVKILIQSDHPSGNSKGLEERKGLWSRCQQFNIYGVSAYIVGNTPWGVLRGQSGIYGPYWIFKDGVVKKAKEDFGTSLIHAKLKKITGKNDRLSTALNYGRILEVMFKE